jgi:hypothetical protein
MRALGLVSVLFLATPAYPCLVFLVSDGKHVFGGNNEDYSDPHTRMWVVPGEKGEHGRVCFGYHDGFTQGGINDAGLFFDGLALDHEDLEKSEKPAFERHPGDQALATCATVKEVVELFERHDVSLLSDAQVLFGDKTGDAVILEGKAVIRKQRPWLLATNFRQSETPPNLAGCERYDGASKLLETMREASVESCRKVLSTTHQEGEYPTVYSNVYDLVNGKIHLYHFHDFDSVVVLDVAVEIAKGPHTIELATLFPKKYAFDTFERQREEELSARREKERDKSVDPKTFDALVGRYRVKEGVGAGLEIRVQREGNKLVATFRDGEPTELVPKGADAFVRITSETRADLTFVRGKGGVVEGVMVSQEGIEVRASRIEG